MTCRRTKYRTKTIATTVMRQIAHKLEGSTTTSKIIHCRSCGQFHIIPVVTPDPNFENGNQEPIN